MRIYASRRRRDRSWVVILASCLGGYLVFAAGFHWFLQPIIVKNSEAVSKPPPAMFPAYPDRRLAEPTNFGPSPRGVAQRSVARPPAELATAEPAEQSEQAERAVEARPPKPRRVAAPRSGTYGAAYPAYSGNRPF